LRIVRILDPLDLNLGDAMQTVPQTQESDRQLPPQKRPALPRIQSRDLLQGSNLLLIEHGGDRYYLRMTRNNRLILTK
jgi:hemin uptake protein HemP